MAKHATHTVPSWLSRICQDAEEAATKPLVEHKKEQSKRRVQTDLNNWKSVEETPFVELFPVVRAAQLKHIHARMAGLHASGYTVRNSGQSLRLDARLQKVVEG